MICRRRLFGASLLGGAAFEAEAAAQSPSQCGAFFAVSVRDLAAHLGWWRNTLRFELLQQGSLPERGLAFALIGRPEALVELVSRTAAAAAPDLEDRSYVHGIFKAGFLVANIDEAAAHARSNGARFAQDLTRPLNNPLRTFALHDLDGNVIQLFGA